MTEPISILILGDLDLGELDRARLERLGGSITALPVGSGPDDVRRAALGARFVIFNNFDINNYLTCLSGAELVVLAATGHSFLDMAAVRRAGVRLANLPDYALPSVVEYLIWAAIEGLRGPGWAARDAPSGRTRRGRELASSTVGVIGHGRIGRRLSTLLTSLGATVHVTSRTRQDSMANWAELDDLLAECDAIFVCCSLTESSRHLLDAAALSLVRPDAIFVSIAPNDVFDLADLAEWLCQRPNAAAVLDLDPLPPGHALRTCPNARVTPHLAFRTEATLRRRVEAAIDLVERAISNQPVALLLDPANDAAPPARRWDSPTLRARDQFLECAYSFLYPQALYALIKLGVLSCLAKGPRSAEGLARELGLQLGPLELLLSAGCSADYLRRSNSGGFELAPMLRGLKGSVDLAPLVVSAVEGCYAAAAGLGDYVRSGVPATRLQDLRNGSDSWSETLTRGSHAVSAPIADALSTRLEGGVGRILDLGAGPASLTRRLLQRNPATSAVLIDTASVLEFTARTYLGPEGLLSRCTLQPGDITSPDPLPAAQDLIIMSNVIHVLDPGENLAVFRRARKALSPDGRLVLLSFLTGSEGPRFNAHFALLCQAVSGSARGYESREVGEMLREAGFRLEADLTLGAFSTAIVARPDTR